MTDAIVATVEHALAPVVPESKYALVRDTYAKGATPQEFELFINVCNRLRLDPMARQIYAVKRWNGQLRREEMTPQVSIDGMRLTAERTGKYAGQTPPEWCGADGVWKDVWLSDEPPMAARVGVLRIGFVQPICATALYREYVQKTKDGVPTKFWRDMPANQLAKCAESLALRKAFPAELSNVYSVDEMAQANNERPQVRGQVQEQRKSLPPPAAEAPTMPETFPNKQYAGKPLAEAPFEVLEDARVWLENILGQPSKSKLHRKAQQTLEALAAEVDRRIDVETGEVKPDAVAEKLQQEIDARESQPGGEYDQNTQWGLEAPQ